MDEYKSATNYKKPLMQMKFLKEDYQDHKEKFQKYFTLWIKEFPEKRPPGGNKRELDDDFTLDKENLKTAKKIYREISKITHPDKVDSSYLENIFKDASTAYATKDIARLFEIAISLNIPLKDIDINFVIKKINDKISFYTNEIDTYINSLPWQWAPAQSTEEKKFFYTLSEKHTFD